MRIKKRHSLKSASFCIKILKGCVVTHDNTNFLQGFKKWQVVLGAVIAILTLYFGDSLQKPKSMIALLEGFLIAGRFKFNFKFNPRNAFLFGLGGLLMGLVHVLQRDVI